MMIALSRRALLQVAGCAALFPVAACKSQESLAAAHYPERPVRFIVPTPAGNVADIHVRLLAEKLSEEWKRPVVVENRPGASGTIGMDVGAKAPPDGYTLVLGSGQALAILPHLMKLPFDPLKDFTPVSRLTSGAIMLLAHSGARFDSLKELIAYSRAHPGELKVAGFGVGSIGHLTTLMISSATGADLTHVPYQGGPQQVSDVANGHVPLLLDFEGIVAPYVAQGKLKPIAISSEQRVPTLPHVPTFAESGYPSLVVSAWGGVLVRAGTPPEIVRKLARDITKAFAAPDLRQRYTSRGTLQIGGETLEEFAAFIRSEHDRWGRVIRENGVRID